MFGRELWNRIIKLKRSDNAIVLLKKNYLIFFLVFILTSCASSSERVLSSSPEVQTLIYANLTEGGPSRKMVDEFNQTHKKVQIEVRDYYSEDRKNARQKLLAEIVAGRSPDIIDLGGSLVTSSTTLLPYQQMAQGGYLENLWPYIESDPELGRKAVLEAPLEAAEIDGGLFIAFDSVLINTLVGATSIVGDRNSWTISELWNAFSLMPKGSTVLDYHFDQPTVFSYIFGMSLDSYVDLETGQCNFDSEDFRSNLEFIRNFPVKFNWTTAEAVNSEVTERLLNGQQMLVSEVSWRLRDIQFWDNIFGGRATFIGYPTSNGSVGSSFYIRGYKLAMSSTCRNKEAAWEFLREMFLPKYSKNDKEDVDGSGVLSLPINRADYELLKELDMSTSTKSTRSLFDGPEYKYRPATEEECQRYENFINSIDKIELCDQEIFSIVQDASNPYFAGDRSLDDTVCLIDNRVSLYLNERQ